ASTLRNGNRRARPPTSEDVLNLRNSRRWMLAPNLRFPKDSQHTSSIPPCDHMYLRLDSCLGCPRLSATLYIKALHRRRKQLDCEGALLRSWNDDRYIAGRLVGAPARALARGLSLREGELLAVQDDARRFLEPVKLQTVVARRGVVIAVSARRTDL